MLDMGESPTFLQSPCLAQPKPKPSALWMVHKVLAAPLPSQEAPCCLQAKCEHHAALHFRCSPKFNAAKSLDALWNVLV